MHGGSDHELGYYGLVISRNKYVHIKSITVRVGEKTSMTEYGDQKVEGNISKHFQPEPLLNQSDFYPRDVLGGKECPKGTFSIFILKINKISKFQSNPWAIYQ